MQFSSSGSCVCNVGSNAYLKGCRPSDVGKSSEVCVCVHCGCDPKRNLALVCSVFELLGGLCLSMCATANCYVSKEGPGCVGLYLLGEFKLQCVRYS